MTTVAIGSIFRNSCSYLDRYFQQFEELKVCLRPASLRPVFVEGDSKDKTWEVLSRFVERKGGVLAKREHGKPEFGSVDSEERWRALAWCCNGVLDSLTDEALVVYVESDLIWEAKTMLRLIGHLSDVPAVAPMCFTRAGHFYDIYGHRKNGVPFSPFPPFHPELGSGLTEIDSAGSCIVMRGEVARAARFGERDCVVGLGKSIRDAGYSLWVDPSLKVVHP